MIVITQIPGYRVRVSTCSRIVNAGGMAHHGAASGVSVVCFRLIALLIYRERRLASYALCMNETYQYQLTKHLDQVKYLENEFADFVTRRV